MLGSPSLLEVHKGRCVKEGGSQVVFLPPDQLWRFLSIGVLGAHKRNLGTSVLYHKRCRGAMEDQIFQVVSEQFNVTTVIKIRRVNTW